MTLKSELVLHDCYYAINRHNRLDQGEDFRLSWWTIISLLRAVGHVLYNIDRNISENYRQIIDKEFERIKSTKPYPEIYWSFIESERNNFLKEYRHGVTQQFVSKTLDNGVEKILKVSFPDLQTFTVTQTFPQSAIWESFITDGPFKGKNEIEIAKLAANWWTQYLSSIKLGVQALNSC